jgi:hypothetical protein
LDELNMNDLRVFDTLEDRSVSALIVDAAAKFAVRDCHGQALACGAYRSSD